MRVGSILFSMVVGLSVALSFMVFPPGARGETIEIQFTGLDLEYDGTDIYDAGGAAGYRDTADTNDADLLTTVSFYKDKMLRGTDDEDVYADFLIKTVPGMSVGGDIVSSTGNSDDLGIDIFDLVDDWNFRLNFTSFRVGYIPGFALVVTGAVSSINGQNLPYDLTIGTPITIISSSTNFSVETSGGKVTKFESSGTGSKVGVPEPSTLAGLLTGVIALAAFAWIRRKR